MDRRAQRGRGGAGTGLWLLLLVLALVGVAAAASMVAEERALSGTTSGEVVAGETDRLASGAERCVATVSYEVDGRAWQTDALVPGGPCPADGGEPDVEVRYDPDSPYVAEVGDTDRGPLGVLVAALLAAAVCAVLLVRSLLARRRGPGPVA